MPDAGSLPLNRRWRPAADVVRYTVNAAHFVDDAARGTLEQRVWQFSPVSRHEVGGLHCAHGNNVLIGTSVAHHAYALHRQEDGEGLGSQVVPVLAGFFVNRIAQFFDKDGISLTQQICVFALDFTQDTDTQAWAWEGVTVDHCWWQAQSYTQFAHFVLEQLAQGLQQFQVQRIWQAAHVVVGFDASGFTGFSGGGLD